MLVSFESFSAFYFISLAIIVLAILFEPKLIKIEKDIKRKIKAKKIAKRNAEIRKNRIQQESLKRKPSYKNTNRNFAA